MIVAITFYTRPNGHAGQRSEIISDDCRAKFEAIVAAGGILTREELPTGAISQTITFSDCDLDIVLTPSGFTLACIKDLEAMILRYTPEALHKMIEMIEDLIEDLK